MSFRTIDRPNVDHPGVVVATETTRYTSSRNVSNPATNFNQSEPSNVANNMAAANNMAVVSVRPIITGRSLVINRSGPDLYGRGSRAYASERSVRSTYSAGLGFTPGSYTVGVHSGVGAMVESRDKEKRDMQDLNERFANYVEKVRFLEAQNKNLAQELEKLKTKWGHETSQVKAMYQVELDEARNQMNDAIKDRAKLEVQVAGLEDTVNDLNKRLEDALAAAADWKEKWEQGIQRTTDAEAETNAMRMRFGGVEAERNRDRKMAQALQETVSRIRADLDNESLLHIEAENRAQSLEEELEFLKAIHEQEMKEMSALVSKDSTPENRAFWKNEMGEALREIQQLYDDKFETMRAEMETTYSTKVQEFKTGATRTNMETSYTKEENKKEKSTDCDSALIPLLCVHG